MKEIKYPEHLVFGLDIGTRSIVGTIGYKEEETHRFKVVAQDFAYHETRAMMDGQIHDIKKVSELILRVKHQLEEKVGSPLTDVCIAAAGRVLITRTVKASCEFQEECFISEEEIHSLELLAVEKAYDELRAEQGTQELHFYCVGYSVIRYYLNDFAITNLDGHKAQKIEGEVLVTFLPEEVIDSLYAAVEQAGLSVVNLTLEPIAAIEAAIPEEYRLLNIALVDVGAGTTDISITKDGAITAYGMIPGAGDEITEVIAKRCLVDFNTAEKIKIDCSRKKTISYKDILGTSHKVLSKDLIEEAEEAISRMTGRIGEKIREMNGGRPPSAVFVVGGGGKLAGFTAGIAKSLSLLPERVALRGPEVLGMVDFLEPGVKKDSLLVTPIGICLNFYQQRNHFIFIHINDKRIKLYNNDKLTIVDGAMKAGIPHEALFPRRGRALHFTLNGQARMIRGELGEAAVIRLNGKIAGLNAKIFQNDKIEIMESTMGKDAEYEIGRLPEYHGSISIQFNGKKITCPKFAQVNGELVSQYYSIQDNDKVEILDYYTVEEIFAFMDVEWTGQVWVNHMPAGLTEKVYENFSIDMELSQYRPGNETPDGKDGKKIHVLVNDRDVVLEKKERYKMVDVLDFYPVDLSLGKEKRMVTEVNGERSDFTKEIQSGDTIKIYWED